MDLLVLTEATRDESAMEKPKKGSGDTEEASGPPDGSLVSGTLLKNSSFHSPMP